MCISENVNGTIFCKLEPFPRPHHIIRIVRQKGAALTRLQGLRVALILSDVQIYLQNIVPLPYDALELLKAPELF